MDKRVAVITGASSGIGKEAAKALAAQGLRIIGTGRDTARMVAASAEIAAAAGGVTPDMLTADLSLMRDAVALADAIAALTDRVDILINNAGGVADTLVMTDEGFEANFAGNHLGAFVLTNRLMPLLRKAADGAQAGAVRILMTASDASEMGLPIDFEDMQNLKRFDPGLAYCTGKLANVLFARSLASRLEGSGIVAHAMAPGATDTNFFSNGPEAMKERTRDIVKLSQAQGADTLIWLATSPEGGTGSGGYWERRAPRPPHPQVEDPGMVGRFWEESAKLVHPWL